MKWVAGWNMPGYLPEAEPVEFDSKKEAIEFLIDELTREGMSGRKLRDTRRELAEYGGTQYKGYAYWVTRG